MQWQSRQVADVWSLYDYGGGLYKAVYFKKPVKTSTFGDGFGSVPRNTEEATTKPTPESGENHTLRVISDDDVRFDESISRTRSTIFELAFCNDFTYFCTFTMSDEKRDRYDLGGFVKDFGQFIRDQNKKRVADNRLQYLIIPEQHKNGAWHFHGFMKGLSKSDLVRNEYGYLDWPEYSKRFGFMSLDEVKSREAACRYVTKYVTKDIAKTSIPAGAHLYYCSQGLKRKEVILKLCGDEPPFVFDYENEYCKIAWIRDDDLDLFNELTNLGK